MIQTRHETGFVPGQSGRLCLSPFNRGSGRARRAYRGIGEVPFDSLLVFPCTQEIVQ
ncbi:MAG: hypothetical protein JWL77_2607 [Chthonomonadaceae bacterium]|nr:hypothetical protein [Chthonomonadaceae bacterium]